MFVAGEIPKVEYKYCQCAQGGELFLQSECIPRVTRMYYLLSAHYIDPYILLQLEVHDPFYSPLGVAKRRLGTQEINLGLQVCQFPESR